MDTTPMLRGRPVRDEGCGRLAVESHARQFWQSRMTAAGHRAEPIDLVDLEQLARDLGKPS